MIMKGHGEAHLLLDIMKDKTKEKGYVTLITTLIVGSLGILVTLGMLQVGLIQTQTAIVFSDSKKAANLANACAEYALQEVRNNTAFTGSATITISSQDCDYEVLSLGGESRRINSESVVNNATKRIQVDLSAINPLIDIDSWVFVESF